MPVEVLLSFNTQSEIENLVCGTAALAQNAEEWTDVNRLSELIHTAHGFN